MGEALSPQADWLALPDLLEGFAGDAGIDRGALAQAEAGQPDPARFSFTAQVPATALTAPSPTDLHSALAGLAAAGGDALTIRFQRQAGATVLDLGDPLDLASVERAQAAVAKAADLDLTITLDKAGMVAANAPGVSAAIAYFLFPEAVEALFGAPVQDLEASPALAPLAEGRRLVCLVGGPRLALHGPHLTLLGGDCRRSLDSFDTPPAGAADPQAVHEQAVDTLHWVRLSFDWLTPLHLAVEPLGAGSAGGVAEAVLGSWLDLAVVYLADETRRFADGRLVAKCGAERYVANMELGRRNDLRLPDGSLPWRDVARVGQLVEWCYLAERREPARVHAVQGVIAQFLQHNAAADNYAEIVRRAAEVDDHKDWAWKSYIEGKLDTYFARVRDVTALVEEAKAQYRDQLVTLRSQVADTATKGVAVVVGTFIAALFQDPAKFDARIFRLGVLLYASYLVVVPMAIGLGSLWRQFTSTRSMYQQRTKGFEERLDPSAVERVLGKEAEAEAANFKVWFWSVLGLYVLVAAGLVWAAIAVPGLIR